MSTREITACYGHRNDRCPFMQSHDAHGHWCDITDTAVELSEPPPTDCPLRESPITISFKVPA